MRKPIKRKSPKPPSLTKSEYESLKLVEEREGSWHDENTHRLLELGLIDWEEDEDNVHFWATLKGRAVLDDLGDIFDILEEELHAIATAFDVRTDWEK